jgi:formate dehydrogenase maturation protein FdhE
LLQRYVAPEQPAVVDALATLRSASAGQLQAWALALVSGQYSMVPAALVPFLGAALQAAWSHWLLSARTCPETRHQPQPVPGLWLTGDGRGDSPSRQAQRPALSGVLAVRL